MLRSAGRINMPLAIRRGQEVQVRAREEFGEEGSRASQPQAIAAD